MRTAGNTFMNAVVGAIATLVLSFLPLSPVLGGGIAGYLQRGPQQEGAKVGGLAGLLAAIPLFLSLLFVVPLFVIAPFGVPNIPMNALWFVVVLLLIVGVYTVGFGIVGGIVGTYLAAARHSSP